MDVAYINPFIAAARSVFDKMVKVPVSLGKVYLKGHHEPQNVVSACIGISGSVTGCVVIGFPQSVALALASGLMGAPAQTLDSDCLDALGEIANMIAGGAKKDLPGEGLNSISLPNLVLGAHRVVYPSGTPIIVIPCETPKGRFVIEVALRTDKAMAA